MNESILKSRLVAKIRIEMVGAVCLRHEDRITSGIPDLSITWKGRTSWWEIKWANPTLRSRGVQDITMLRLSAEGYARYIVYEEVGESRQTVIAHPKIVHDHNNPERWRSDGVCTKGHNHRFVVDYMKQVHTL